MTKTTSPSRALKAELTKTFPGVKFQVTTSGKTVYVEWLLEVGSAITKDAVKAIADKHETVQAHGDLIDDTRWYSGYSISLYPKPTDERKAWAVECIDGSYHQTTWNERWERFESADGNGKENYHATKEYWHYVDNGVVCDLVNEYGHEPSEKHWYYERQKQEQESVMALTVNNAIDIEETQIEIIPNSIQALEKPIYVPAKRPSLNKQCTIEEYTEQTDIDKVIAQITKVVILSASDYDDFTHDLLNDYSWLKGEGGNDSHYKTHHTDQIHLLNDKVELEKWLAESYTICVLVTDRERCILVDPQGYSYARYVLLCDSSVLNELNIQEQKPKQASVIMAGSEKTPKAESESKVTNSDIGSSSLDGNNTIAKVESIDSHTSETDAVNDTPNRIDYESIYRSRVERLLSQGRIAEITSFEEWKRSVESLL